MAVVSLALFKKHVRADDFADDDEYLEHLLSTAEECVIKSTNRSEQELIDINDGEFPLSLKQAIMMLGGHWYNQRESVSGAQMYEVPYSLQAIVKPYRKLVSDASR